jgi:hypothetical protein
MWSRNIILFFLLVSTSFSQSSISGYGYGSSVDSADASSLGVSNKLMSSFKSNVSLSNPSTWHNLLFTYLSTSINFQSSEIQSSTSKNFSLSSGKIIVPWKQQMSFGISFEPYLSRQIAINDSTLSSFTFDDQELFFKRTNKSSGGPSIGQLSFGFKLNEFDSIGSSFNVVFGSSRSSRILILDNDNHLLQSRDYFSGTMIDLLYSTKRVKIKEKQISLSLAVQIPLGGIDIENDSYQAFIDINDNNFHDTNDFPDVGQALLPLTQKYSDELQINSFTIGADYEFSLRKHIQIEFLNWKDSGNHNLDSSLFGSFIESRNKLSISYMKFAQPFSRDRYNFKGSFFIQNYGVKNLENINEVGLGLGVGVNFGITGNQIDFGYKFSKRSGLHLIDKETLHTFNVGVSIGDLWFVKRREI